MREVSVAIACKVLFGSGPVTSLILPPTPLLPHSLHFNHTGLLGISWTSLVHSAVGPFVLAGILFAHMYAGLISSFLQMFAQMSPSHQYSPWPSYINEEACLLPLTPEYYLPFSTSFFSHGAYLSWNLTFICLGLLWPSPLVGVSIRE